MFLEIILLILLGSLMGLVIPRLRPVNGILFTFFLSVIYLIFNFFFFVQIGIIFKIVYPLLVIVFSDLFVVIYKYATEEKEKKWIKNVFSTYITPSVVNKILKEPDLLKLGGERREMTVYFSDISGFTTISEALSPKALVSLINEYLNTMTNIIFKLECYKNKDWNNSIKLFQEALHIIADDGPSKTYLHRCQEYKENPPPPDWDGVWELKTK